MKKVLALLLVLAFAAALAAPAGAQVMRDGIENCFPDNDYGCKWYGLQGPAKPPYVEVFLFGGPDPEARLDPPPVDPIQPPVFDCSPANVVEVKPNALGGHFYSVVFGQHLRITKPEWKAYVDENGRTQFPIRYVSEAFGYQVDWNQEQKKVTISRGGTTIEMYIGSQTYYVNGEPRQMDTTPRLASGRTFVPLRFLAEAMGCEVDWRNCYRYVFVTDTSVVLKDMVRVCN